MANLTASSTNPTVTWDDTDTGVAVVDWRMISGSGPMKLEGNLNGGSYEEVFEWRQNSSESNKSLRDLDIATSQPTLLFDDTDSPTGDTRIRVNSGNMYFEENGSGSWATNMQIDSDYVFANNGIVAGTTNRNHALQWQLFTGAMGSSSPLTVDVTLGSSPQSIQGAIVMITTATNDDADAVYRLYDYRTSQDTSTEFHVDIERGNASNQDTVKIYFDTDDYGSNARYKILAFYSPVI